MSTSITSDKSLTYAPKGSGKSYTITPNMGVVNHFPGHVCKALIELGAKDHLKTPKKTDPK